MIGESVMLSARSTLGHLFTSLSFDAKVGRQANEAVTIAANLARRGQLSPTVVVQMGDNGPIPSGALDRLLSIAGPSRHLVLLTVTVPRRWESQANDAIRDFANKHPEVSVADWHAVTTHSPGLTGKDGVHLSSAGIASYANLIGATVGS